MSTPEAKPTRETWQTPRLDGLDLNLSDVNFTKGVFGDGEAASATSGAPV